MKCPHETPSIRIFSPTVQYLLRINHQDKFRHQEKQQKQAQLKSKKHRKPEDWTTAQKGMKHKTQKPHR